jgi:thiol:disulfide interchange protein
VLPLLATVIPLGLAAAVRPGLFALQLLIVGQPHWWPRARAFGIGAALPLLVFGALVFFGFNQLPKPETGSLDILGISLRTIIGLAFIAAAIWLLFSHPQLEQKSADFLKTKATDGIAKGLLLPRVSDER